LLKEIIVAARGRLPSSSQSQAQLYIFTTTMMIGDGIGNQQSAQGRAKLLIIYTHFIAGLD
jgi:hypothetical protein